MLLALLCCLRYCPMMILVYSCHARPNIDATSPVDCECIMPLESLLANFKLLAVDNFLATYKRCNEYGCWISCWELLTALMFDDCTACATESMSVVEAVKPLVFAWNKRMIFQWVNKMMWFFNGIGLLFWSFAHLSISLIHQNFQRSMDSIYIIMNRFSVIDDYTFDLW